jgi:hypothetical protein
MLAPVFKGAAFTLDYKDKSDCGLPPGLETAVVTGRSSGNAYFSAVEVRHVMHPVSG